MNGARPAVFLDRDGVLNEVVMRNGYPSSPRAVDQLHLVADIEAVNRLAAANRLVFIITNQPDIARGHISDDVMARMIGVIRSRVHVDDVRVCPHDDADECACRKPRPGMLLDLARQWHVDLHRSFMVGDTWRDVGAAQAAGCRAVLIRRDYNRDVDADFEAATLAAAIDQVLENEGEVV